MARIERRCAVTDIEYAEDERVLVVRGTYARTPPTMVTLRGNRIDTHGTVTTLSPVDFESRVPLHAAGWLEQHRMIPSGDYLLEVSYEGRKARTLVATQALGQTLSLHEQGQGQQARVRLKRGVIGQITIELSPPLAVDEVGKIGRAAVTKVKRPTAVVNDALYLQSWFGKSFSDNPAPLASALRADFREVFVGVHDYSVEIPDHVTPVVIGSRAWWEAITSSRVVVDNSWLPRELKRRDGQFVVQTWHGTPLKKLGYHRSQHEGRPSTPQSFKWGSDKWDLLVSPNEYSTEILRHAYTYDGRVAQIGYPRNDVLVTDNGLRQRVRSKLGIAEDEVVVLYAPTFRESAQNQSVFCNVQALGRALGAGYRLLVRGHSATLRNASRHQGAHVLDVTSYPESSHMLAIADVLVTDYSSVMFDFTATRRPVVFFTPDIDSYAEDGRGVYFDLAASAPGPVIREERQLAGAVRRAWRDRDVPSPRYDAWVARFNAHDDGGATERLAAIVRESL